MAYVPDEAICDSHTISHAAFKLYVCYCSYRNSKSGLAFPSRETINELTGINLTYISDLKKELERAGWLTQEGAKIRLLKGFQNQAEKSDSPTPDIANKEVNGELNDLTSFDGKKSDSPTIQAPGMSDSPTIVSDSPTSHIKEHEPIELTMMNSAAEKKNPVLNLGLVYAAFGKACKVDIEGMKKTGWENLREAVELLLKKTKLPAQELAEKVLKFGEWFEKENAKLSRPYPYFNQVVSEWHRFEIWQQARHEKEQRGSPMNGDPQIRERLRMALQARKSGAGAVTQSAA